MSTRAKQKRTARAVRFCLEMKRADAHEASCEATHEAGLRPMKRGFATRRSNIALRFMAALPPLHASQRLALREANASLTKQ